MSNDNALGWRGKQVRHVDGRTGRIRCEFVGFMYAALTIDASDGAEEVVQLNTRCSDSGAKGWAWLCENFSEGAAWLPLGNHNEFDVVMADKQVNVKGPAA